MRAMRIENRYTTLLAARPMTPNRKHDHITNLRIEMLSIQRGCGCNFLIEFPAFNIDHARNAVGHGRTYGGMWNLYYQHFDEFAAMACLGSGVRRAGIA
jgi:hypothetical protein